MDFEEEEDCRTSETFLNAVIEAKCFTENLLLNIEKLSQSHLADEK